MGTFVLALHSHLPYCRGAGRWPHGEEWIHEAVLGTYLPLLVLLHDLRDAGVRYRIVIGLTPMRGGPLHCKCLAVTRNRSRISAAPAR